MANLTRGRKMLQLSLSKKSEEHEKQSNKTSEEHEKQSNKASEEHEKQSNKASEEHEKQSNKTSEEHEKQSNKASEEHEKQSNKASEEHEKQANKTSKEHEKQSNKASEEHEKQSNKAPEECEKQSNKTSEEYEKQSNKASEEYEKQSNKASEEYEKKSNFVEIVDEMETNGTMSVPVFHMPEIADMNNEEALHFLAELLADKNTVEDGDDSAEVSLCEVESFLPTMETVFETLPIVTDVEIQDDPSIQDDHDKEEDHANKPLKRKMVLEELNETQEALPVNKKARNGRANPNTWRQNVKKKMREKGRTYQGKKKNEGEVEKGCRSIKTRCSCKIREKRSCGEFSEDDRKTIFSDVWEHMNWDQRKVYVNSLVDVIKPIQKVTEAETSRRSSTYVYHLKKDGVRKRVCRQMFTSTTDLGTWSVKAWCGNATKTTDKARSPYHSRGDSGKEFLRAEFLEKIAKLPSHYCRAKSTKLYLEPDIRSMSHLYNLYSDLCREHEKTILSRKLFVEEFNNLNLSLFQPKKDQCDICVAHETGNTSEDVWSVHIARKEESRAEKAKDKALSINPEGARIMTLAMDLQAVLLSPRLKASALYYKTKLSVHNFTIYNLATKGVRCYVWHEGEGGLTASEFASCILDYLYESREQYDTAIIYSDGCTYQNRNAVLANALQTFVDKYSKVIIQKILEKGHTQMEVDSVHSAIEQKLKNTKIYCPADYVRVMEIARKTPAPYDVKYLDHTFFKDFTKINHVKSIRPGSRVGDPTVTSLRCIKFTPNEAIQYKLNYLDDWNELPQPRGHAPHDQQMDTYVTPLYTASLPIKSTKYKHLQELKTVMPADYHIFYDNLSH